MPDSSFRFPLPGTMVRGFLLLLMAASPVRADAQTSAAHIVVDTRTKKIVMGHKVDEKFPVASLTKIVTACVALDWLQATGGDRERLIPVSPEAVAQEGGNPLQLRAGDQLSVRDALFSMLLASDAVSAHAIAEHFGLEMWRRDGGRASDAVAFFVSQMNALARSQGMLRSHFVNPHGADHMRKRGYSTAADMARIGIHALEKPSFNFIVQQRQRDITLYRAGQPMRFRVFNTNKLLGQHGCDGVKTGRTSRAGECFVASARRPDEITKLGGNAHLRIPYHLVIVTLNSQDRFAQVSQLIHQGFDDYERWIKGDRRLSKTEMLAMPE